MHEYVSLLTWTDTRILYILTLPMAIYYYHMNKHRMCTEMRTVLAWLKRYCFVIWLLIQLHCLPFMRCSSIFVVAMSHFIL